jgi:hypothetical protein
VPIVGIPAEMEYSSTAVEILMIKDPKNKRHDDKISIRKNFTTNDYEIVFTDTNFDSPFKNKVVRMYRHSVLEYAYFLLKNQKVDSDGYKKIQVNVPAMPSILLEAEQLNDVYFREHLHDLISFGVDLLDNAEAVRKKHVMNPEEDEEKYTAEDYTYSYNTPTPTPSARSTPYGVRPQHLFFDE